jgi:hypothetical protein
MMGRGDKEKFRFIDRSNENTAEENQQWQKREKPKSFD